jgi:hypothetical protein
MSDNTTIWSDGYPIFAYLIILWKLEPIYTRLSVIWDTTYIKHVDQGAITMFLLET